MRKEYTTKFVAETDSVDNESLSKVLNAWAEDGFVLHSIIPYLSEGTTTGYTIVFETEVDDN